MEVSDGDSDSPSIRRPEKMFPKHFFTTLLAIALVSIGERGLQAMRQSAAGSTHGASSSGGAEKVIKSVVVFQSQASSGRLCDGVLTHDASNKLVALTDRKCWDWLKDHQNDGVRGKLTNGQVVNIHDVANPKFVGDLAALEASGGELALLGPVVPWTPPGWSVALYAATLASSSPELGKAGFGIKWEMRKKTPVPWRAVVVKNDNCNIGRDKLGILFCVESQDKPQPGPGSPFYAERDDDVEEVLGVRQDFATYQEEPTFFTYIAAHVLSPHQD